MSQEWDLAEANRNQSRAERPPEESMTAELSELAKLSSQLNSASENVNGVIARVNDALASMNLGVQTWLKNYLWVGEYFTPTLPMVNTARTTLADVLRHEEIKDEARRDSPDLKRSRKAVQLGYARAENTFQLSVRSVTIEEFVNPAGEFAERIVNPGDPQPLTKASRNLRIDALGLLPQLTDEIKHRVQTLLENIEKGKMANSSERTYIIRILPEDKYEVVYEGGHQRQAGQLRHLRTFLLQSAIAGESDLDRIESDLRQTGESKITVTWGKFFC